MTRRTEAGVMMMTTERVLMGTRPTASLHRRSVSEDAIETTVTYMTSFVVEMHVAELKIDIETESVKSKNSMIKGTMISMVLIMINLTGSGHQKQDIS
jgi:hypothetical protein